MSAIIFATISILLIISIIVKPKLKWIDTYVLIAMAGAILMLLFRQVSIKEAYNSLAHNEAISPLKILILFFTMTFLSIVCDSLGLFNFLAYKIVGLCKKGQFSLYTILYVSISILTIFTSNDIIILTFTPFIIHLCKRSGINPIPYLVGEFVAANTASMTLLIGNPTNIVLSLSAHISFTEYFLNMWYIAILTAAFLYVVLILLFFRSLKKPMALDLESNAPALNKFLTIVAVIHLGLCTILLSISNYINLEMYLITTAFATSLLIILLLYTLITKKDKRIIKMSLRRLPYSLIPFLISMFIMVEALNVNGYTEKLSNLLNKTNQTYTYGISSYLASNVMNNIPMSILYSNALTFTSSTKAIYASIIGSNLGAYLTPLGALAGIMWLSILKAYDIKFSFLSFIKYGFILSLSAILFSLTLLYLI